MNKRIGKKRLKIKMRSLQEKIIENVIQKTACRIILPRLGNSLKSGYVYAYGSNVIRAAKLHLKNEMKRYKESPQSFKHLRFARHLDEPKENKDGKIKST